MSRFAFAIRSCLILVVLVSALCTPVHAALSVIGDVLPVDNFFTGTFEGITPSEIDTEEEVDEQTKYEKNENITVGVKLAQGGRLDLDGSTQLRYQDLIIGARGLQNGIMRTGTGTVLITGNGALYSNDPTSLPPELESIGFASDPSVARETDVGFDVYVGQWGQGRLELRNGGRAEIQDAVIIGDQPGSTGVVTVDGFGTLLSNGGFESSSLSSEAHQMIVGRQGTGQMFISNGALVVSEGPTGTSGTDDVVGAVIGSDAFEVAQLPELGGTGIVTVNGIGSRWVIGGSLQIGGYHDVFVGVFQDTSGANAIYNSAEGQAGRGTLIVEADSLVKVRSALGVTDPENNDLLMAIGRFGTVDLRGGLIDIGDGTADGDSTPNRVQVINDGLITGYGRIQTGSFNNRYFGQVRVSEGESLIIDSKAEFSTGTIGNVYPLINFGLIEVIGTAEEPAELEFVRPPASTGNPLTPLINRPVETTLVPAPTTFDGGLISAQHARLRFTSGATGTTGGPIGMQNEGTMAFTAGTNIISGNVVNIKNIDDPAALDPKFIIGPNTTVVVEDDFTVDTAVIGPGPGFVASGPIIDLGQGATLIVLDQSTLTLAGVLNMDLGLTNSSRIEASGDVGLGGVLNVSLQSDVLASLASLPGNGHGSTFEILSFAGQAFGTVEVSGVAQPDVNPIAEGISSPFDQVNVAPDLALLFPDLDAVVRRIDQGIYLSFLNPMLIGGGAMGSDFNGDGVVDGADLAIWKANKGITSGASVLQGDADGDGDVDGADYLIWLDKFTNGGVPGGSPMPSGSVPEPTGIALLSMGAMLALAFRRRRS